MDPTALFTSRSGGKNFSGQSNRSGNVKFNKQRSGYLYCDHCDMKGHNRADCNKLKYCIHCHKHGHLKESCYQLIGYPTNYKGKRQENIMTTDYNPQFNNPGNSTNGNVVDQMQQFKSGGAHKMSQQYESNPSSSGSGAVLSQHFTPDQYQQVLQMMNKSLIHEGIQYLPIVVPIQQDQPTKDDPIDNVDNGFANDLEDHHQQDQPTMDDSLLSSNRRQSTRTSRHPLWQKDFVTTFKNREGIIMHQRKYALEIISDLGLGGSKPIATPVEMNGKLTTAVFDKHVGITSDPVLSDIGEYQRLVGRLIYLTITRPDLSYAVQNLSQFMNAPKQSHMNAAIRVVRYIKQQPGLGILLSAQDSGSLQAFCDADWESCPDTRRSITGYMVTFGESLLSWKSKKQSTVSRSSAETEYRSMASTVAEVTCLYIVK
uniref:Reverse transcriptase Ty1/copia-type domain-containing protein n=1 Tax=Solanum lycopersicum TaxID=4081 RepID=A0A3Q7FGR7_SOLLC